MGVAESDAVLPILLFRFLKIFRDHIDLFIDFLVLFKYVLLYRIEARLQVLEELNHELRVLSILPGVEASLFRTAR